MESWGYDITYPMKTIPWEVNVKKLSDAYVAGFLDGDGSILATVEKRPERRRFPYRIRLRINFTQHNKHIAFIKALQVYLGGVGSVRNIKKYNVSELVIQDRETIEKILKRLLPHIVIKERQAKIMLSILNIYEKAKVKVRSSVTEKEYLSILLLVKEIRELNSRTNKKINLKTFNPVTT